MMIMHLDPNYSIFIHITMVYIFDIKTRVVIFLKIMRFTSGKRSSKFNFFKLFLLKTLSLRENYF